MVVNSSLNDVSESVNKTVEEVIKAIAKEDINTILPFANNFILSRILDFIPELMTVLLKKFK